MLRATRASTFGQRAAARHLRCLFPSLHDLATRPRSAPKHPAAALTVSHSDVCPHQSRSGMPQPTEARRPRSISPGTSSTGQHSRSLSTNRNEGQGEEGHALLFIPSEREQRAATASRMVYVPQPPTSSGDQNPHSYSQTSGTCQNCQSKILGFTCIATCFGVLICSTCCSKLYKTATHPRAYYRVKWHQLKQARERAGEWELPQFSRR